MLTNILVILALLFILALILAPIYYFVKRDKYADESQDDAES